MPNAPMTVFEYAMAENETVHLMRQMEDDTLCGRNTAEMTPGDETVSGIAATCKTCRRIGGLPTIVGTRN